MTPIESPRTAISITCLFLLGLIGLLAFVTAMVTHPHRAHAATYAAKAYPLQCTGAHGHHPPYSWVDYMTGACDDQLYFEKHGRWPAHKISADATLPAVSLHGYMIVATLDDGGTPPKTLHQWDYTRPGALWDTEEKCKAALASESFKVDLGALAEMLKPMLKQYPDANISMGCAKVDTPDNSI